MARVSARRIWHAPDPEWYVARICFKTGPPPPSRTRSPSAATEPPAASHAAPGRARLAHPSPSRSRGRPWPRRLGGLSFA